MKITSKGQVTIPKAIRKRYGFRPNTEVEFVEEGNTVKLVKKRPHRSPFDDVIGILKMDESVDEYIERARGR